MILATDVHYTDNRGIVAGVAFESWMAEIPSNIYVTRIEHVGEYVPGEFYKRELPCILKLIDKYSLKLNTVIVDGYVYTDGHTTPGLGKHLYDALNGRVTIIGVAKSPFIGIGNEHKLYRGNSKRPLYITCEGESLAAAKNSIAAMFGKHRMPLLLKIADQTCRQQG
jgi:deoxyribonuclease V